MNERLYLWKQQQQPIFIFQSHENIAQSFLNTSNQSKHTIQKLMHKCAMAQVSETPWHQYIARSLNNFLYGRNGRSSNTWCSMNAPFKSYDNLREASGCRCHSLSGEEAVRSTSWWHSSTGRGRGRWTTSSPSGMAPNQGKGNVA